MLSRKGRSTEYDALPTILLVVASIGMVLDLVVGLLFHMGRQRQYNINIEVTFLFPRYRLLVFF